MIKTTTSCLTCHIGHVATVADAKGVKGTPDQAAWGGAVMALDAVNRVGIDDVMKSLCPECREGVEEFTTNDKPD
jgi:hypothetical protein